MYFPLAHLALDESLLHLAALHLARNKVDFGWHVVYNEYEVVSFIVAYMEERIAWQAACDCKTSVFDGELNALSVPSLKPSLFCFYHPYPLSSRFIFVPLQPNCNY